MEISPLDRNLQINKKKENELSEFANELSKSLNKNKNPRNQKELKLKREPTIYEDLLENNPLAQKYKSKLKNIIKNAIIENSYQHDFYYLEQRKNKYYLVYCNEGEFDTYEVKPEELKKYRYTVGKFYQAKDAEHFVESSIKEDIKIDAETILDDMNYWGEE
jgi:hypothetical protein